uniref:Putative secreted protein n=1 Tax=Anopheles triannulatus TaxID=58253 RepID=A0A2M4B3M2_9DIPT
MSTEKCALLVLPFLGTYQQDVLDFGNCNILSHQFASSKRTGISLRIAWLVYNACSTCSSVPSPYVSASIVTAGDNFYPHAVFRTHTI